MKINPIVWVIAAVIVLAGLFVLLMPKKQGEIVNDSGIEQVASSPAASVKTEGAYFELNIKGGKLVSSPEILKVTEGQNVSIKITSDENEEFHLHGYDKSVELEKDITSEITFVATLTGRFVYELENSKVDIGALEVSPL